MAKHWLFLLRPLFAYNVARDAYVMRGVGLRFGPVLREERRTHRQRNRRPWTDRSARLAKGLDAGEGVDSRHARLA